MSQATPKTREMGIIKRPDNHTETPNHPPSHESSGEYRGATAPTKQESLRRMMSKLALQGEGATIVFIPGVGGEFCAGLKRYPYSSPVQPVTPRTDCPNTRYAPPLTPEAALSAQLKAITDAVQRTHQALGAALAAHTAIGHISQEPINASLAL